MLVSFSRGDDCWSLLVEVINVEVMNAGFY